MKETLWPWTSIHQVEWLAVFAIINRYIPSVAYSRQYASAPDVYRKRGQTNIAKHGGLAGLSLTELDHTDWKICPECGDKLPETAEYWHRDNRGRNGLQSVCIRCRCAAERARYHARRN